MLFSRSLVTALFLFLTIFLPSIHAFPFVDVTLRAGLKRGLGRRKKYGGVAAADLDGDGHVDLICGHHDDRTIHVYFNNRDGTFSLSPFRLWRDTHGITPFRLSPAHRALHFLVSPGGAFGKVLSTPKLFRVSTDRKIVDITAQSSDFERNKQRGRASLFLYSLRSEREFRTRPDVLVTSAPFGNGGHQRSYEIEKNGIFKFRSTYGAGNFSSVRNSHVAATDVDGDGHMEVLSFKNFGIWKSPRDASFKLVNINARVLPKQNNAYFGTESASELDFDNDGTWDLFLTRSATAQLDWITRRPIHDILLKNVGGRYIDITKRAQIPIGYATTSRGATVGDFDNDGFVDIFICRYDSNPDMILLRNLGNGRFKSIHPGFNRSSDINGDAPVAVDYDQDGRLDLIVSEGDWFNKSRTGFYRIMKNMNRNGNSWLLVRVKNAPRRKRTSLHAVVTVETRKLRMIRRVGSPGTMVSNSFIETVHFGLGKETRVKKVTVRWTDGTERSRENVFANRTIAFGVH